MTGAPRWGAEEMGVLEDVNTFKFLFQITKVVRGHNSASQSLKCKSYSVATNVK